MCAISPGHRPHAGAGRAQAKGKVKQVIGKVIGQIKLKTEDTYKDGGQGAESHRRTQRHTEGQEAPDMSKNTLYLVVGLLAVVVAAAAIYVFYQENQKPSLDIRVDRQGITVK